MRKKLLIFLLLSSCFQGAYSKGIRIGIYSDHKLNNVLIKPKGGGYSIISQGRKISDLPENELLSLSTKDDLVVVSVDGNELGRFTSLKLERALSGSSFRVKPIEPAAREGLFDGDLQISVRSKKLILINHVGLEEYVAGVMEGEIGMHSNMEFLKVQAIICRTYAVSSLKRHNEEGFDLCDLVHCQVYRGKSRRNPNAVLAVQKTAGKVITDKQGKTIIAAFHSNCGGETSNSEDIWPSEKSYLKSVRDSFCMASPNCQWQVKIPAESWTRYLNANDRTGILKTDSMRDYTYEISSKSVYYNYKEVSIPAKKIRNDWNLKSGFFSIRHEGDTLFFYGRGYGHGIGLCQEGAMRMAALGHMYRDIINFYYRDVTIDSLSYLSKH